MSDIQIDIGAELEKGWHLYKANMGLLILAGLIGMLVSAVTCGVLGGPLTAGLFLMIRRLMQNDPVKPQAGDVFKGLDVFLQTFLCFLIVGLVSFVVSLVLGVIPVLGQLASMVVSMALSAFGMWALLFVTYQKMTAVDALKKVWAGVSSGAFVMPLVFGVIASFLGGVGILACGVGVFFTMPFAYCSLACAYETLYGGSATGGAEPVEAEVIPPPPPPPSDLRL